MWKVLYNEEWAFLSWNDITSELFWNSTALMMMVLFNFVCYQIMDHFFDNNLKEYSILEKHQKRYVVKNLTKTFILFLIVIGTLPWLYDIMIYNIWNNKIMHLIGTVYVSTDLSGLLFVSKLATRTKVHHTIVCILGFLSVMTDYRKIGLHRALLTLTYMSAIPYTVNAYLGLRHLNRKSIKQKIVDLALYVYCLSILINILIQHFYIFLWVPDFSLIKIVYLIKYYSILFDDLKLAQYLFYKYKQKYAIKPIDEKRI